MKSIFKNILPVILLVMFASLNACKKDLSSLDTNPISGVSLVGETGILTVKQFDNLMVAPTLNFNGNSEDDFSYEWKINYLINDTTSMVLAQTKNLNAPIGFAPTAENRFHDLVFTVTDKKNGVKYINTWQVKITTGLGGEGLMVATTPDGVNSDLNLILSPLVSADPDTRATKYKLFSTVNGKLIKGVVKQMRYGSILIMSPRAQHNTIFAISDQHMTRIKTQDFSHFGEDGDLFFGPSPSYNFQALDGKSAADIFVYNNSLTIANHGIAPKIAVPMPIRGEFPAIFSLNRQTNHTGVAFQLYDENSGAFKYIPQISTLTFQDRALYSHPVNASAVFNSGNLPNKTNVAAGIGKDEEFVHILKDKTSNKYELYVFSKGVLGNNVGLSTAPAPKYALDLSSAPGISNATNFLVIEGQEVIYYVSGNKLYAVPYAGGNLNYSNSERFTIPAGEAITTLNLFKQTDYPWGASLIAGNINRVILSTYGGTHGSGKVYIMPMINAGVANIDAANIETFTGFDRITAITSTK